MSIAEMKRPIVIRAMKGSINSGFLERKMEVKWERNIVKELKGKSIPVSIMIKYATEKGGKKKKKKLSKIL
jgi:hypothetical protein